MIHELRRRNPDAKMLAYVVGQYMWDPADFDSLNHYPTRFRRILDHNNGWLYNQRNNKFYAGNVNLAKKDANGRYVVADSLALLWKDVAIDSGIWDGLFYDILCDDMYWSEVHGESINIAAAGYTNRTDFNNNWHAATDTIATLMRNWGGPNFILVGNCALGTKYTTFNGWMREGFPFETGGTWYTNMFWRPGGYMTDEANFLEPRPRDFRRGIFKWTSVKDGGRPTRADLLRVLELGVYGTSMPSLARRSAATRLSAHCANDCPPSASVLCESRCSPTSPTRRARPSCRSSPRRARSRNCPVSST